MNVPTHITINGKAFHKDTLSELYTYASNDADNAWMDAIVDFLNQWFNDDQYIDVNTSGSTGTPKRIALKKAAMAQSAVNTLSFFQLQPGATALLCLPAAFIAGKMMLVRAIVGGLHLLVRKPATNFLDGISDTIDFTAITPMQLEASLGVLTHHKVRNMIVGGAPVSQPLLDKLLGCQTSVYESYGMTETASHIALKKISGTGCSPFFKPLPGVEVRTDSRGCLAIKAENITDNWLFTNDLVNMQPDGSFAWLGRFDNIINSGGVKISPEMVEGKLRSHINFPFVIASVPDDTLFEKIIFVAFVSENESIGNEGLFSIFSSVLTTYEKPRAIVYVPQLAVGLTGKINRAEIKKHIGLV